MIPKRGVRQVIQDFNSSFSFSPLHRLLPSQISDWGVGMEGRRSVRVGRLEIPHSATRPASNTDTEGLRHVSAAACCR